MAGMVLVGLALAAGRGAARLRPISRARWQQVVAHNDESLRLRAWWMIARRDAARAEEETRRGPRCSGHDSTPRKPADRRLAKRPRWPTRAVGSRRPSSDKCLGSSWLVSGWPGTISRSVPEEREPVDGRWRREVGGVALSGLPVVWAQVSGTATNSLAPLALRRWYSSLTLSSPEAVPSLFGLWAWLGGLAALVALAVVFQGPGRALRQVVDLPGHVRLVAAAVARLRRAWRVLAVTIGMTVVAWTGGELRTFSAPQGRDDLVLLTRSRGLGELALEQGIFAALTPLRDVFGLADNMPLLFLATVVLFRVSAARWGEPYVPLSLRHQRNSGWVEALWGSGALYILYRLISLKMTDTGDLPLGGCIVLEVVVVPVVMVLLDGAILGWILVELRSASLGETNDDSLAPEQAVGLLPGTALACLAALPARYLATAILLLSYHLPTSASDTALGRYIRWQLSWGLADVQGAALVVVGLAGVVAWSRGTLGGAVRGYARLLAAEGGHLAALLTLAGLAAGSLAAVAYLLVLSLPVQTWVLAAADGYAHYATLPVGLTALAALVELGERSLPAAALVEENQANPADSASA